MPAAVRATGAPLPGPSAQTAWGRENTQRAPRGPSPPTGLSLVPGAGGRLPAHTAGERWAPTDRGTSTGVGASASAPLPDPPPQTARGREDGPTGPERD